jgi:vacuolar protein sorting-associated protein 45
MSGTVTKHVTLVSELSKLVNNSNLMELSEAEQFIASQDGHQEALQKVKKLMRDTKNKNIDILRLISLYSLRYDKNSNNEIQSLKEMYQKRPNVTSNEIEVGRNNSQLLL